MLDTSMLASPGVSHALISPGDLLEVTVTTGRHDEKVLPQFARVGEDGAVDISVIGNVPVAAMETTDAEASIRTLARERGIYRNPRVTVQIEKKAVDRIAVMGAVVSPGAYELPRGACDLVSALAASGGFTEEAGTTVEIVRQPSYGKRLASLDSTPFSPASTGDIQLASHQQADGPMFDVAQLRAKTGWSEPQTIQLDLAQGKSQNLTDFRLQDRDIVNVLPRKKEVIYVDGLVKQPGQYEIPHDQEIHLLDAIALAGGRDSPVGDKILVIRRVPERSEPVVIQASLSAAKKFGAENIKLAPGDTVTIEQTPVTVVVDTVGRFFNLTMGINGRTFFR